MNRLEKRLRTELPALADHFVGPADQPAVLSASGPAPRRTRLVDAAAIALLVAAGVWLAQRGSGDVTEVAPPEGAAPVESTEAEVPDGPGTWTVMSEAPIQARHFAPTAWTGSEMIVWGGTSLDRLHAFTDAAAYDSSADAWRALPTPGWGHPGSVSTYFDGQIVVAAKGRANLLDLVEGTASDLLVPDWLGLRDVAVVGGELYGFGGTDVGGALRTIRYDPGEQVWIPGPSLGERFDTTTQTTPGLGAVAKDDLALLWSQSDEAALLDTAAGELRLVPRLGSADSDIATAGPVVTTMGFVVVATLGGVDVVATLDGDRWSTVMVDLPNVDLDTAAVFGSGEWVMILPVDSYPVSIHVSTATVVEHDGGPLGAMVTPNGVWTGDELILWGGASEPLPGAADPPLGVRWTPPTDTNDDPLDVVEAPSADAVMVRVIEPLSRNDDGVLEACGPQPCFGIPIDESRRAYETFDLGVVEGWYDGVSLLPTTAITAYTGDLGVLGERPDLPSLCPNIRGPGQQAQAEMRPALRAYTDTVPDQFAASWNDQGTQAQLLWFVGDDIAAHQAAIAEIAGDVEICVAGGARWSEVEMQAVRDEVRTTLDGARTTHRIHEQRIIVDTAVLDAETRDYLETLHPAIMISPPRIEAFVATVADVPAQQPVVVGDVDLPTHDRGTREQDHMSALGTFTLAFDDELECFYRAGENGAGERTIILWPVGYSATAAPATVFDSDGRPFATVGHTVELGGGWVDIADWVSPQQQCGASTIFVT